MHGLLKQQQHTTRVLMPEPSEPEEIRVRCDAQETADHTVARKGTRSHTNAPQKVSRTEA